MIRDTRCVLGTFQNPFPKNYPLSKIIRKGEKDRKKSVIKEFRNKMSKSFPGYEKKHHDFFKKYASNKH